MRSWGRGVIGVDKMCLLNNALNQWFSTGGNFSLPSIPGDIWPCLWTLLFVTTGVGGVLLVSSGWGPRTLLNILNIQDNPHNKELSGPKR